MSQEALSLRLTIRIIISNSITFRLWIFTTHKSQDSINEVYIRVISFRRYSRHKPCTLPCADFDRYPLVPHRWQHAAVRQVAGKFGVFSILTAAEPASGAYTANHHS